MGLRKLQATDALSALLGELMQKNQSLAQSKGGEPKPILVKIAPDLDDDQLHSIVRLCMDLRVAGMIVANTTTARQGLRSSEDVISRAGTGGLSGAPLTLRSRDLVAKVYRISQGAMPIIGVGGIMSGEDAWEMIRAGASLVQVYTGFIYGGPGFVASINRHLLKRLAEAGKATIEDVIGEASRSTVEAALRRSPVFRVLGQIPIDIGSSRCTCSSETVTVRSKAGYVGSSGRPIIATRRPGMSISG